MVIITAEFEAEFLGQADVCLVFRLHFEDHAALQGLQLPEWSHLAPDDARRYTEALLAIIERDGLWRAAAEAGAKPAGATAPP